MTSVYSEVKGRYPLLGVMGSVAEVGVRSVSYEAMKRATPILQSLEPQIEVANSFALVGLDRLEKNFPILNQSTDEVVGHLKDAFFVTLDDVQMLVTEGLDGALDQVERLADAAREAVQQLQETQVGRAAMTGLDDVMSRLEDVTAFYLPLPPTLRQEWERGIQEYEDEDDDEEPSLWSRLRCLLLNLNLQFYHRLMKLREQLQKAVGALGERADKVGLGRVLQLVNGLLQFMQSLLVALVYRTEGLKETTMNGIRNQAAALAELPPVHRVLELPVQVQQLLRDLQEVTKLFVQLVINATPLYNMLQQPSAQDLEDFLNQEDFMAESSSRRNSVNNLFLKAMDGRTRRRRSLFKSGGRTSVSPETSSTNRRPSLKDSPTATNRRPSLKDSPAASDRRSSFKDSLEVESLVVPSETLAYRRPSATEILFTPLKQFVTQSQKAFEYLSPNTSNDTVEPEQDN
uniref:Uncharacterized LOC114478103 n=2 Tax=Gouania willdenowi TaxID=441366 RepID=A0A8C5DSL4_GOUWI